MRRGGLLICAVVAVLTLAQAGAALAAKSRTVRLKAPVPGAGQVTVLSFLLTFGGEGRAHHRSHVHLELHGKYGHGIFATVKLVQVPHKPGRYLGVLDVFHRTRAAAAALSSIGSGALNRPHAVSATAGFELTVQAVGARLYKETLKQNIVSSANEFELGPDEFCEPEDREEYLLSRGVLSAALLFSQPPGKLPPGATVASLANDALEELCDEEEDFQEHAEDEIGILPSVERLRSFLGVREVEEILVQLAFEGAWGFEGPQEVRLSGMFTTRTVRHSARSADSTNPITALKVVLPPAASIPRAVTNYICPARLPSASIVTSSNANDTLLCKGGDLPVGQGFNLNVQSSPAPASGMGAQIFAEQDGVLRGPYAVTGP